MIVGALHPIAHNEGSVLKFSARDSGYQIVVELHSHYFSFCIGLEYVVFPEL